MYNLANARRLAAFKLGFWQKKKNGKSSRPLGWSKEERRRTFSSIYTQAVTDMLLNPDIVFFHLSSNQFRPLFKSFFSCSFLTTAGSSAHLVGHRFLANDLSYATLRGFLSPPSLKLGSCQPSEPQNTGQKHILCFWRHLNAAQHFSSAVSL